MGLTISSIENAAPDQASLKAATKLLTPAKWPEKVVSSDAALIWGDCQGSGANPYRVVVDLGDLGSKCSCPSRKFPCKHALALMLQYSAAPADFGTADVPAWVTDWLGRRRKTAVPAPPGGEKKSLAATQVTTTDAAEDPAAVARREAASVKRAAKTTASIADGLAEMEAWISDQLRTGLTELLADLTGRCRRIASRLVDAKAATLAGRIDGIPARILALPEPGRPDALIAELGKLVLISRSWNQSPDVAMRRLIIGAETRDELLGNEDAVRCTAVWEVLASRDEAQRDGLIARSTWLLSLEAAAPRFALLQDFFPASLGNQGAAFETGDQFHAEVVFYPAPVAMRAQIVERKATGRHHPWPDMPCPGDVLLAFSDALSLEPWLTVVPILLPAGHLAQKDDAVVWTGAEASVPVTSVDPTHPVMGADLHQAVVLWNGHAADLLAADTHLGRFYADA